MKIRPLQDRVVVQPILEKEVRKGEIIIPDSAKEKPIEGRVTIAVSPAALMTNAVVLLEAQVTFVPLLFESVWGNVKFSVTLPESSLPEKVKFIKALITSSLSC